MSEQRFEYIVSGSPNSEHIAIKGSVTSSCSANFYCGGIYIFWNRLTIGDQNRVDRIQWNEGEIVATDGKFWSEGGILIDFVTSWRKGRCVACPDPHPPTRYQITPNCGPCWCRTVLPSPETGSASLFGEGDRSVLEEPALISPKLDPRLICSFVQTHAGQETGNMFAPVYPL